MGQNGGRVLSGRAGNVRRRITLLSWEDAAALYQALSVPASAAGSLVDGA